ncbi:MAG: C39 family peptidase [Bacilli bacterium]|nr:C39 family peptidase [Bacilli bacterium]
MNKIRFKIILLIIISLCLISGGIIIQINTTYNIATESLNKLYQDKNKTIPIENIKIKELKETEAKINKIYNKKEKEKLLQYIYNLKEYVEVKVLIDSLFNETTLKYEVNDTDINTVYKKYNKLNKKYQKLLKDKLNNIKNQKEDINNILSAVNNIFKDDQKSVIKESLTRDEITTIKQKLEQIPQKNNMVEINNYILIAEEQLLKKEQELEKKKKEEEIKNAWVILDVPYISQNLNQVYNGCEAASLLMGLQYKGYLKEMDIITYSANIPKTDNPNTGFYRSIFDVEPSNLPHWIAPEPLAKYGRETSGNNNVVNITGKSLDELNKELENNNPVVIYATAMFESPKNWIEEVPNNLHVMLLTGYNKITKEQIITDPWTYKTGRTKWTLSKEKLENLYNKVGKKAVTIR